MHQSQTTSGPVDPRFFSPFAIDPFNADPFNADPFSADPFGADPAPSASERRLAFVVVIAVLLGIAAGSLAYLLRPDRLARVAGMPVVAGSTSPDPSPGSSTASRSASTASAGAAGTAVAGVRSRGVSGGALTGGSAGSAGAVDGDGSGDGTGDDIPPASLVAHVSLLSPGSGTHPAGTPLTIKVSATHPLTGKPLPGFFVHWTVTTAGHLLRSGYGKTGTVPGYLMTSGGYHVHVEYASKGLSGSDDATVSVPFELKPTPKPSPTVPFPAEITGVKPSI